MKKEQQPSNAKQSKNNLKRLPVEYFRHFLEFKVTSGDILDRTNDRTQRILTAYVPTVTTNYADYQTRDSWSE